MLINDIKIGDRLEITLKRYKKNEAISFISLVEEKLDSNLLLVQMPVSYGKLVKLPQNQEYSALFFTDKGMIRFDTTIESFLKQDEFHMMKIKLTNSGERVQRRNFFRLPCVLPIKFTALSQENDFDDIANMDTAEESKMAEGIIRDLGGGGVRFVSNDNVEGEKIQCFIELQGQVIMLIGKVLQKQNFPKSNYLYQYRLEFLGILPQEREQIVQYIFSEQSKMIQKIRK